MFHLYKIISEKQQQQKKKRVINTRKKWNDPLTSSACPGRSTFSLPVFTSHTFSVLSLLPLTNRRLSADHATWYTAATWPRSDVKYLQEGNHAMESYIYIERSLCELYTASLTARVAVWFYKIKKKQESKKSRNKRQKPECDLQVRQSALYERQSCLMKHQ